MGVGQLGGDVELEVLVVGDDGVTQFDDETPGLAERLFEEDGLQRRVELLPDVLQQTRLPEANGVLEAAQEVAVRQLDDVEPVVVFLGDARGCKLRSFGPMKVKHVQKNSEAKMEKTPIKLWARALTTVQTITSEDKNDGTDQVFDPLVGLTLRIDEQRPPSRELHDHPVLHAQRVLQRHV